MSKILPRPQTQLRLVDALSKMVSAIGNNSRFNSTGFLISLDIPKDDFISLRLIKKALPKLIDLSNIWNMAFEPIGHHELRVVHPDDYAPEQFFQFMLENIPSNAEYAYDYDHLTNLPYITIGTEEFIETLKNAATKLGIDTGPFSTAFEQLNKNAAADMRYLQNMFRAAPPRPI